MIIDPIRTKNLSPFRMKDVASVPAPATVEPAHPARTFTSNVSRQDGDADLLASFTATRSSDSESSTTVSLSRRITTRYLPTVANHVRL
jgi:hypothetical protein